MRCVERRWRSRSRSLAEALAGVGALRPSFLARRSPWSPFPLAFLPSRFTCFLLLVSTCLRCSYTYPGISSRGGDTQRLTIRLWRRGDVTGVRGKNGVVRWMHVPPLEPERRGASVQNANLATGRSGRKRQERDFVFHLRVGPSFLGADLAFQSGRTPQRSAAACLHNLMCLPPISSLRENACAPPSGLCNGLSRCSCIPLLCCRFSANIFIAQLLYLGLATLEASIDEGARDVISFDQACVSALLSNPGFFSSSHYLHRLQALAGYWLPATSQRTLGSYGSSGWSSILPEGRSKVWRNLCRAFLPPHLPPT
ncbi:hypothetical protein DFH06DRAFT_159375 [Mycena polygramma]|nr:hypothetical protein DFH06DRAFT_159375 [Mycena polygramma]